MDDVIDRAIDEHGWFAASIADATPPFVYTIGLLRTLDHPELIVFGLERNDAYGVLAATVEAIREGASFAERGEYDGILQDALLGVREVHSTQHPLYLGYAMGYCRRNGWMTLRAVQLFWPDRSGSFPYQPNCDIDAFELQPRTDLPLMPDELEDFESALGDV